MGSKGGIPHHLRRPLPGPGLMHPDPFGPGGHPDPFGHGGHPDPFGPASHPDPFGPASHPDPFGPGSRHPPGAFPFDMLPPLEIMEQKLAAQQVEMQTLATENQRIAATHSILRQELGVSQQELQRLQTHMGALKAEQEQQIRVVYDKMSKMEADLQASESVKLELQQAHAEFQSLIAARQDLISKIQQLNQDLHRSHDDTQQIPTLMSELESVRQEYQHCRATYDYERKLRVDHSEQLQVMEKNYISMVREVEALRSELSKASNVDRSGAVYASNAGYKEGDAPMKHSTGQNAYEDGYGVSQGRGSSGGVTNYAGGPAGPSAARAGYELPRGAAYDASGNSNYDASRTASYNVPRAGSYEAPRGGGAGYAAPRGPAYDASSRGAGVGQPAAGPGSNTSVVYGSAQAPTPYGSAQGPTYGSAQAPSPYGSAQAPSPYGSTQAPSPYGTQTPTHAAAAAAATGGYEAPQGGNPATFGGGYEAPRIGNAQRR